MMRLHCRICGRPIVVPSFLLLLIGPPNESAKFHGMKWHLCLTCGRAFARHMDRLFQLAAKEWVKAQFAKHEPTHG